MTPREAAIVSAYTGYLIGDFDVMHAYVEEVMGRPVFTHELGSQEIFDKIHEASKPDFVSIGMISNAEHREAIERAIVLGLDVESADPNMSPLLPDLTRDQIAWLASWLASEGIGRLT